MRENKNIKKRLSFDLSAKLHSEIKLAAYSMGITIKEFTERAWEIYGKYLNKEIK